MTFAQYAPLAFKLAEEYGIDPALFVRQINQESGFQTGLTSSAGASGIAQIMPATAEAWGVDPNDPEAALRAAAKAMAEYTQQYGPIGALIAYNAGPGAVGNYLPEETKQYISAIAGGGEGMATDFESMSDEELLALDGGSSFGGGSLPWGYTSDRGTGKVYRLEPGAPNGRVEVGMREIQAAMLAQQGASSASARTPAGQLVTDERTGTGFVFNPATGQVTSTGQQLAHPGIDPREAQAAENYRTGFSGEVSQRGQTIQALEGAQNRLLQAARDANDAAMSNSDRRLRAAQSKLQAATDVYRTTASLIPALGALSLQESERVQGILSEGDDYLARAFEEAGGKSPLAKVSQADQINAVRQAQAGIRSLLGAAPDAEQFGLDQPDVQYQAPNLSGFQTPDAVRFAPPEFSTAAPPVPGAAAQGGMGVQASARGGAAGFNPPAYAAPVQPKPYVDAGDSWGGPGSISGYRDVGDSWGGPGSIGVGEGFYDRLDREAQERATSEVPAGTLPMSEALGSGLRGFGDILLGAANNTAPALGLRAGNIVGDAIQSFGGEAINGQGNGGGGVDGFWQRLQGYAEGGFTTDRQMVVGDSLDDKPNPEVIDNPTGAPISIRSSRFGPVDVPHYATGTISLGAWNDPDNPYLNPNRAAGTAQRMQGGQLYDWQRPTAAQYESLRGPAPTPAGGGFNPAAMAAPAPITQDEIIRTARDNAPPAVTALFGGTPVARTQLKSQETGSDKTLPIFTARQLSGLSADDAKALGTRTLAEFNAPLDYVAGQTQQQYGAPNELRQGGFGRFLI